MRYTVVGVIDGRRMEMPVQACSIVDAMHTAEAEGMIVTDVRSTDNPAHAVSYPPPPPKPARKPGTDSPILCAVVGLLIPVVGLLMVLLKIRKDPAGALGCLLGSLVGLLLWGGMLV